MNAKVREILKSRQLLAPSQFVFEFDDNNFVQRFFKPIQKEAGIETAIAFHDLRYTFASHLVRAGVSIFDVKTLLGHSDIKVTMKYAHLAPDHLRGLTYLLLNPSPDPKGEKSLRSFYAREG